MGWMFNTAWNRSSLVSELTEGWSSKGNIGVFDKHQDDRDYHVVSKCLKHCYRGNSYTGVLWAVWETNKHNKETDELTESKRWIGCYLLRYRGGEWGYKDMEEGMCPCYCSCPLGYLKMAPVASEKWREGVRAYHEARTLKFKPVVGMYLKMKDGVNPKCVKVDCVRPLRGRDTYGILWKVSKKHVDCQVEGFPAKEKSTAVE